MPQKTDVAIRRGLLKNTALMTVSRVGSIAASLLTVPLIIRQLGLAGYGIWEAITALSALTTTLHNVIVGTLLWKMSEEFGRERHRELGRYAFIGLSATVMLAVVVTPPIWIWNGEILRLLHLPSERTAAASRILPLAMTIAAFSGINEVLAAILGAYQRIGIASIIQGMALVLTQVTALICLTLHWGLWSLLVGSIAAFVFSCVALTVVSIKTCHLAELRPVLPTRQEIRSMSRYAGYLLVGTAAVSLREHTDKIVLAVFGGSTLVGKYALASRLASVIIMACGFFSVPMIAAVGRLNGAGDWDAIRSTYGSMLTAISLTLGAIVVMIATTHRYILELWIGTVPDTVPGLLFLLLFGNLIAVSLSGSGSALCRGISRMDLEATYAGCSVAINLVLTVVLVYAIGPLGTVIGSCMSWVGSAVFFLFLLRRYLGLQIPRVASVTPVVAALTVLIIRLASSALPSVASLSAAGLVFSGIALSLAALLFFGSLSRLCGVHIVREFRGLLA